jgi:hypothetical protein
LLFPRSRAFANGALLNLSIRIEARHELNWLAGRLDYLVKIENLADFGILKSGFTLLPSRVSSG